MSWSIRIENLSKQYRIGSTTTTAAELINEKLRKFLLLLDFKKGIDFHPISHCLHPLHKKVEL